jgi:glutaconyl-CoA/methylmalonyl-CoA decarboxylase subunit gamma
MIYKIAIRDKKFEVEIGDVVGGAASVSVDGIPYDVVIENYDEIGAGLAPEPATAPARRIPAPTPSAAQRKPAATSAAKPGPSRSAAGAGVIVAQIPGRIMAVHVGVGDTVKKGQTVAIMEAMKMENNVLATRDGIVKEVNIQKGSEVATGDVMMVIE